MIQVHCVELVPNLLRCTQSTGTNRFVHEELATVMPALLVEGAWGSQDQVPLASFLSFMAPRTLESQMFCSRDSIGLCLSELFRNTSRKRLPNCCGFRNGSEPFEHCCFLLANTLPRTACGPRKGLNSQTGGVHGVLATASGFV